MPRAALLQSRFDVAVIGGGPAGAATAALLARAGRSVLLCDAARFPRHKICGEFIPPAAVRSVSDLGVLHRLECLRPRRPVGMAVVAPDGTKVLGRYGETWERGMALRRYEFDTVLIDNAAAAGALVLQGTRVRDLARQPGGGFELDLRFRAATEDLPSERPAAADRVADRATVSARVVVGADGRNSLVARRLGMRRADPRHRRWAIMGHFRNVDAPDDHGEMIVTPYGYCGINPLPGDLTNICIVVDPARERGAARPSSTVRGGIPGRSGLAGYFAGHIDAHPLTRRRMAGAALSGHLRATGPMAGGASWSVTDGALLVGDAARFYDPFTGEGIAMALRGASMAVETLLPALAADDLRASRLRPYAVARRAAFDRRLRLDRLLQTILERPRLTDWVAGKLRRDQRLADLLAQVTGDVVDASAIFSPAFMGRFLLA